MMIVKVVAVLVGVIVIKEIKSSCTKQNAVNM